MGKNKNSVAICFSKKEKHLIDLIKKELPFYSSVKEIPVKNSMGLIYSIFFPLRAGKEIKKNLCFDELGLKNGILPDTIKHGSEDEISMFLRGIFTASSEIRHEWRLLRRVPVISLNHSSIDILKDIQIILDSMNIPSSIENNSDDKFNFQGREFSRASRLLIKGKAMGIFAQKIGFMDSERNEKCLKH